MFKLSKMPGSSVIGEKLEMTLLEEIANGESATLEFKESRPKDSLKYTKTVVAFANGRGGRVLFGVEDGTGVVKGIDNAIDRLEILSPGGLLKEITIEEVKRGYSKIRNKGLADALVYMHEVENWGGGVARYFTAMQNAKLPPPVAEEKDGFFKVVFWRPTTSTTTSATPDATPKTTTNDSLEEVLGSKSMEVYKSILSNPLMTINELAILMGLTNNGIKYHIKRLKATCGLHRVGGRKEGKWDFSSRP